MLIKRYKYGHRASYAALTQYNTQESAHSHNEHINVAAALVPFTHNREIIEPNY